GRRAARVEEAEDENLRHRVDEEREQEEKQRVDRPGLDPARLAERRPRRGGDALLHGRSAPAGNTTPCSRLQPRRAGSPVRGVLPAPSESCLTDRVTPPGNATKHRV